MQENWIIKVIKWLTEDSDENPYGVIVSINDVIRYLSVEEYNKLINFK